MKLPCNACNGDGFVSHDDRHVENRKEVCETCHGYGEIEARTGQLPEASASSDGTTLYASSLDGVPLDHGSFIDLKDENGSVTKVRVLHPDKLSANDRYGAIAAREIQIDGPIRVSGHDNKPTRLTQLFLHDPDKGQYGDCQRTCFAMMLGYSNPEHVPHFGHDGAPDGVFWDRAAVWLGDMGYKLFQICYSGETDLDDIKRTQGIINPGIYYMLAGRSPRGTDHVVICLGDAVWADPHPLGGGIVGPQSDGYYRVEVMVPTTMTEYRRPEVQQSVEAQA